MNYSVDSLLDTVKAPDTLEALTRPILEMLEMATGLRSSYLTYVDQEAGRQDILYARNTSDEFKIPEGLSVPWDDTLCKRAMEEGRPFTDRVDTCWGDSSAAKALGIRTYVSQPVSTVDGELFGTLCAASNEPVSLSDATLALLSKCASLIATQVERESALRRTQAANAELSQHALSDTLTGLANRRGLERAFQKFAAQSARDGLPLMVALVDLDKFKHINDTYGHATGDEFLVYMARKLTCAIRPEDLVSRTGGDEFVILVRSKETAPTLQKRLSDATRGHFSGSECEFDYEGASVGVTVGTAGKLDLDGLIKQADVAMYEVKRQRRSR